MGAGNDSGVVQERDLRTIEKMYIDLDYKRDLLRANLRRYTDRYGNKGVEKCIFQIIKPI